ARSRLSGAALLLLRDVDQDGPAVFGLDLTGAGAARELRFEGLDELAEVRAGRTVRNRTNDLVGSAVCVLAARARRDVVGPGEALGFALWTEQHGGHQIEPQPCQVGEVV